MLTFYFADIYMENISGKWRCGFLYNYLSFLVSEEVTAIPDEDLYELGPERRVAIQSEVLQLGHDIRVSLDSFIHAMDDLRLNRIIIG